MTYARVAVEMSVRQKIRLLAPTPRSEWDAESPWLRTFHYNIPSRLDGQVAAGQLVWVPFGRKQAQGIVIGLDDVAPIADLKDITRIVDHRPVLTLSQVALGRWMSQYYLCPLFDTLCLMLPIGVLRRAKTLVSNPDQIPETEPPSQVLRDIVAKAREAGPMPLRRANQRFGAKLVQELVAGGWLSQWDELPSPRIKPKVETHVRLLVHDEELATRRRELGRDTPQAQIMAWLSERSDDSPKATVSAVLAATGASTSSLASLRKKGVLRVHQGSRLVARTAQPVDDTIRLTPRQREVLAHLESTPVPAYQEALLAEMGTTRRVLQALIEKGLVERREREATVELAVAPDDLPSIILRLRGGSRHAAMLDALQEGGGAVALVELRKTKGYSPRALNELVAKGFVELEEREVRRDPLEGRNFAVAHPPRLAPAQEEAMAAIADPLHAGTSRIFLIHGVTGSGKTEIYLRAVREILDRGRQAIILVPEISLTPQTIQRFAARFSRLAVIHSRLSPGERYDEWRRIRDGEVDVVIGPRSALFSPLPNLGLIVLDEEHESAYKQDEIPGRQVPCYHARDVAAKLGEICNAPVILGSATPSLTSYYRAQRGAYALIKMPKRIMGHRSSEPAQQMSRDLFDARERDEGAQSDADLQYMDLPEVQVVDLRQELHAGNRSIFSRVLQSAMEETLAARQQAILFLNRRGAATFVMCRDCGHVIKCPQCDVPMTYHSSGARLLCHRCNQQAPPPKICPECGSKRIRYFGIGTQRVEKAARGLWPSARILRWDSDAVAGGVSHDELMGMLVEHQVDIVIGTQMIAKGLDLPLVTLVGVVTADTSLNLPDFRAGERTFQLLEQVSGRAGRSILGGRVIVQTYAPEHYAVRAASRHDYEGFFQQEIAFRRSQGYPPLSRLAKLVYSGESDAQAAQETRKMERHLRGLLTRMAHPRPEVVGPTPCFLSPRNGRHRWQFLILGSDLAPFLETLPFRPGWHLDVDPLTVL